MDLPSQQPAKKPGGQRESVQNVRFQLETKIRDLEQRLELKDERFRTEVERKIKEEVKNSLTEELRLKTKMIAFFGAGFLLFVTFGMLQRETLFKPVVKYVYPPQDIYKEITKDVESNVWATMKTGDKEKFSEVLGNGQFYPALKESFRNDIVNTFGTTENQGKVSANSVLFFGEMSVPTEITMLDRKYDGKETSCQRLVKQDELQAVVVLPQEATDADYRWFGCSSNYPELTELKLVIDGKMIDGVSLVGVERNGSRPNLEVRVTRKVAETLELSGGPDYTTYKKGKVSINKSEG